MAKINGIVDLETSLKEPKPTLDVQINRVLASDLGLSVNQIANVVRPLIAGDDVTTWQDEKGETYDVNLRLTEDQRSLPSDLQNMYITSNKTDANNQLIFDAFERRPNLKSSALHKLTDVIWLVKCWSRPIPQDVLQATSGQISAALQENFDNATRL